MNAIRTLCVGHLSVSPSTGSSYPGSSSLLRTRTLRQRIAQLKKKIVMNVPRTLLIYQGFVTNESMPQDFLGLCKVRAGFETMNRQGVLRYVSEENACNYYSCGKCAYVCGRSENGRTQVNKTRTGYYGSPVKSGQGCHPRDPGNLPP